MNRSRERREIGNGPEFDNKLIRLVRENPAIYDINHQHYRRNAIRIAIWDGIAAELGAPSKFLQTKWKNIRYNYLQEVKCMETGKFNINCRKRRFTEDLSFLQTTAMPGKNGVYINNEHRSSTDNDDSSGYIMYPDVVVHESATSDMEIIDLDNSEDESLKDYIEDNKPNTEDIKVFNNGDNIPETSNEKQEETNFPILTIKRRNSPLTSGCHVKNPWSSPLLVPFDDIAAGKKVFTPVLSPISKLEENPKQSTFSKANMLESMEQPTSTNVKSESVTPSSPFPANSLSLSHDPIEMYCMSIADSLRCMSRSERERVKFEFANILKDAKYKDQNILNAFWFKLCS